MAKEDNLPKKYQLKCKRCPYKFLSTGLKSNLAGHKEIPACCGKRNYKCPKCGNIITLSKVGSRG